MDFNPAGETGIARGFTVTVCCENWVRVMVDKATNFGVVAAAVLGFVGVALGAFGAHALGPLLQEAGRTATWETAVLYHLVHGVAALWAAARFPVVCRFWLAGVVVFSGSLYVLCLSGLTILGAVTPIGGVLFLVGWGLLAVSAWKERRS
jgi:uncharacterized membrane protein YgdD (TMEM256/DUF423 family)